MLLSNPALAHRLQVFASADGDQIQGRVYFVGGHPARGVEVQVLDAEGTQVAKLASNNEGRFRVRVPAAADYRVVAASGDGHQAEWPIAASELFSGFVDEPPLAAGTGDAPGNAGDTSSPSSVGSERLAGAAGRAGKALTQDGAERSRHLAGASASNGGAGAGLGESPADCLPIDADLELVLSALVQQALRQAIEQGIEPELERSLEQVVARQVLPLREALAEAQAQASFRDVLGGIGYIAGLAGLGLLWTRRRRQRETGADKADG